MSGFYDYERGGVAKFMHECVCVQSRRFWLEAMTFLIGCHVTALIDATDDVLDWLSRRCSH